MAVPKDIVNNNNDNNEDDNDEEEDLCFLYLSKHSIAMRKALRYCLQASQSLQLLLQHKYPLKLLEATRTSPSLLLQKAQMASLKTNLDSHRKQALENFHNNNNSIEILPDLTASTISPREFRRRFQQANVPCKIRNLRDDVACNCFFQAAHDKFVINNKEKKKENDNQENEGEHDQQQQEVEEQESVNHDWFLSCLGPETMVPVRLNPISTSTLSSPLDEAGRATECETKYMSVRDWIDLLHHCRQMEEEKGGEGEDDTTSTNQHTFTMACRSQPHHNDDDDDGSSSTSIPSHCYYLKDWHLQAWLQSHAPQHMPLYHMPPHFGVDLLNRFLTKFCTTTTTGHRDGDDGGGGGGGNKEDDSSDYYFCYWGPRGSQTLLHSDVLSSFSWSYNVCGTKKWTFYPPSPPPPPTTTIATTPSTTRTTTTAPNHKKHSDNENLISAIQVIQEAGEAMFVPSNWPHEVENLVETLSLNHNWITTANLDLVWEECLIPEMTSIEHELASWKHVINMSTARTINSCDPRDDDNHDSTATTTNDDEYDNDYWEARESMLRGCVGLDVTAFFLMMAVSIVDTIQEGVASSHDNDDYYWDWVVDLTRLQDMLRVLVETKNLSLQNRLQATLADQNLGQEAYKMATTTLIELIEHYLVVVDIDRRCGC